MLIFGAFYILADALIHLFNIRLTDTLEIWPTSAIAFSGFISQLYASFALLTVGVIIEVQKNIKKNAAIVLVMGIWAIWHGGFLGYQALTGFSNNFQQVPSLYVWLPFYNSVIFLESILLILFGTMVVLWRIKDGKSN